MTSIETIRFFICGFLIGGFLEGIRIIWVNRNSRSLKDGEALYLTILLLLSLVQFVCSVYGD